MKKVENVEYTLPFTISELIEFAKDAKFVRLENCYYFNSASFNEGNSFGDRLPPDKQGYRLYEPRIIERFAILVKFFVKKKEEKKAKTIVNIFNKYIKVKQIKNPEIMYREKGEDRDYYRCTYDFWYDKPKVENFTVYEIFDKRPKVIVDFMNDLYDIVSGYIYADKLEAEAKELSGKATKERTEASKKMDLVKDKFNTIIKEAEMNAQ